MLQKQFIAWVVGMVILALSACTTADVAPTPPVVPPSSLTAEAQLTEVAPSGPTAAAPPATPTPAEAQPETPSAETTPAETASPAAMTGRATEATQMTRTISVNDPWVRASVSALPQGTGRGRSPGDPGGPELGENDSAAFMTIINTGDDPITLTGVATDVAAQVEMFFSAPVQQLQAVSQIEIPARSAVAIEQGPGYHIILRDLQRELQVGDTVTLTLTFQDAGQTEVQAPVRLPTQRRQP